MEYFKANAEWRKLDSNWMGVKDIQKIIENLNVEMPELVLLSKKIAMQYQIGKWCDTGKFVEDIEFEILMNV